MSEKAPAVAVVYLPELMDPLLIDPEVPFDEQVPEPYRERVRQIMAAGYAPGEEVS